MVRVRRAPVPVGKKAKKARRLSRMLPKKPKRPTNAFGAFMKNFWSSMNRQDRVGQSLQVASAQWKALTQEQKAQYGNQVQNDRARYATEITQWKRTRAFLRRPASVYAMFVKDIWERERNNGLTVGQMGKLASAEWKNLPADQKIAYQQRFQRCQRNYTASIRDFYAGLPVDLDRKLDTEVDYVPLLAQQEPQDAAAEEDDIDDEEDDEDFQME